MNIMMLSAKRGKWTQRSTCRKYIGGSGRVIGWMDGWINGWIGAEMK